MSSVGRFAPSPSGRIHLGNILCCLLAWLSARQKGGKVLLRIEDLDTARCPRRYSEQMLEDLHWLGLDWDEECVIFGIAARIASVKDLPTLVKAFAQAVKECPNARLLIAGDGEQRQSVEALAKELCPEGSFHFTGWIGDMNSFYHALDVNMLSSISETFPYAITEGARLYCATISTA